MKKKKVERGFEPRVSFIATEEQLEALRPIGSSVRHGGGSILGQVFLDVHDEPFGKIEFCYINAEATKKLQRSLRRIKRETL